MHHGKEPRNGKIGKERERKSTETITLNLQEDIGKEMILRKK